VPLVKVPTGIDKIIFSPLETDRDPLKSPVKVHVALAVLSMLLRLTCTVIGEVEKIGSPISPIISMAALGAKDDVGIGTYNLAVLNITNNKDYYIATEITMAKVEELDILDPLKKQVILKPRQTKQLFWKVKVHEDLNPKYRYEIPLGYFTIKNESTIGYFTVVDKGAKYTDKEMEKLRNALSAVEEKEITTDLQLDCTPEQAEFFQNTQNQIICRVKNAGNIALSANI